VRWPTAGGEPAVVLAVNGSNTPFIVRAGEITYLQWASYPPSFWLVTVPIEGGAETVFGPYVNRHPPTKLVSTPDDILWAEEDRVVAVSRAGVERTVLSGAGAVLDLQVVGTDAFVAVGDTTLSMGMATLIRAPLDGTAATTLAVGLDLIRALQVNGEHLYWAEPQSLA
jgi:hypothetical protein